MTNDKTIHRDKLVQHYVKYNVLLTTHVLEFVTLAVALH